MRFMVSQLVLFCVVVLAGCNGTNQDSPPLGKVSGTVIIDGKQASNVAVNFSPVEGGRPSSGVTGSDGAYRLVYTSSSMGAIIGKHRVTISNYSQHDINEIGAPMDVSSGVVVPEYAKIVKEVTVERGSNTINLEYP